MERIRNAPHAELRAILLTLCDDPADDGDLKQRIFDHLRVLQHFNGVRDSPVAIQLVRDASKAELRAVLLAICDDHVSTLNRALDFLRVLALFQEAQENEEDEKDKKDQQKRETSAQSSINHISQAQLDGAVEGNQASHFFADMTCVNCEKVFDEKENHSKACNRHQGKPCHAHVHREGVVEP